MYIGLHVKCPLFSSDWIFFTDFRKIPRYNCIIKIRPVGPEFFHAFGRTDMTKLMVVFRKFAKSASKAAVCLEIIFQSTLDVAIKNAAVFVWAAYYLIAFKHTADLVTYLLGINRCEFDCTPSVVTTHWRKEGFVCRETRGISEPTSFSLYGDVSGNFVLFIPRITGNIFMTPNRMHKFYIRITVHLL
jgi:hypothetical protein